MRNSRIATIVAVALVGTLAACSTEADTVNHNLSKDAESFKVQRKIVFINGITDKELLRVEGRCSYELPEKVIEVICKVGPQEYVRHAMAASDNVTAVIEQTLAHELDPNHYKFVFRPQTLIPDVDYQSGSDASAN